MGKLHTLRRAIVRNPEAWFEHRTWFSYSHEKKKPNPLEYKWRIVKCAAKPSGKRRNWEPVDWYPRSYRGFVKSVLKELRYEDLI